MVLSLPPPKGMEPGDDFEKWLSSVEIYMSAMGITKETQKKCIVLHLLGPELQEIYKNLAQDEEAAEGYKVMVDKLKKYFKPATNPVVERHIFSQMKYEAKSVEEYVASLRSQARKCNYTAEEMDDRIRDKLVSTCPSSKVKVQLLKEEDLTLAKAIKVWSTDSHIQNQAEKLSERKMKVEDEIGSVNKI